MKRYNSEEYDKDCRHYLLWMFTSGFIILVLLLWGLTDVHDIRPILLTYIVTIAGWNQTRRFNKKWPKEDIKEDND